MVPTIAATISTASKTTASLSDAKNSKIGLRCHAGCSAEFEVAMRDRHIPRGKCLLQGGTRCPQHVGRINAALPPGFGRAILWELNLASSAISFPPSSEKPIHLGWAPEDGTRCKKQIRDQREIFTCAAGGSNLDPRGATS